MKSNKTEVPAVVNSIAAGVVVLVTDPLKPRTAQVCIKGFITAAEATPDLLIAIAADSARLVKSPGFQVWAKQCGNTSSLAARRAAGAKKAWETKRKKMAQEARVKGKSKAQKKVATNRHISGHPKAVAATAVTAPTKRKVTIVRSTLNPIQPKSAKLPLTATAL